MRIYAIVEMGGEGAVRAFSSDVRALAAAKKAGGMALEAPPTSDDMYATGIPQYSIVEGTPATVFLVCCGDGGCTNGYFKAFLDEAAADAAAAEEKEADQLGLSYYVIESDVE